MSWKRDALFPSSSLFFTVISRLLERILSNSEFEQSTIKAHLKCTLDFVTWSHIPFCQRERILFSSSLLLTWYSTLFSPTWHAIFTPGSFFLQLPRNLRWAFFVCFTWTVFSFCEKRCKNERIPIRLENLFLLHPSGRSLEAWISLLGVLKGLADEKHSVVTENAWLTFIFLICHVKRMCSNRTFSLQLTSIDRNTRYR